eukprot:4923619-Pyramimonas_sp.AAC.1
MASILMRTSLPWGQSIVVRSAANGAGTYRLGYIPCGGGVYSYRGAATGPVVGYIPIYPTERLGSAMPSVVCARPKS